MTLRYHDEGWSEERDEAAYFYATEGGDTWNGPPRVPAARERPDPGEYTEPERERWMDELEGHEEEDA